MNLTGHQLEDQYLKSSFFRNNQTFDKKGKFKFIYSVFSGPAVPADHNTWNTRWHQSDQP
jgi:hypothetical protein